MSEYLIPRYNTRKNGIQGINKTNCGVNNKRHKNGELASAKLTGNMTTGDELMTIW